VYELDQQDHPCVWHLLSGSKCGVDCAAAVLNGCGDVNTRVIELDISVTFLKKKKKKKAKRAILRLLEHHILISCGKLIHLEISCVI